MGRWRRRLATTLVLVIATELVVYFWADIVLDLQGFSHVYLLGLVAVVLVAVGFLVPPWLLVAVGWVVGLVGLDTWLHAFLAPAQALGYGLGLSTLGAAILSPAFFAIRRSYARHRRRREVTAGTMR